MMMNLDSLTEEQRNNIMWLSNKIVALNIGATFAKIDVGPVVTGYYFNLGPETKLKQLLGLGEDLALALSVDKVNIQRVGGHCVVFIPNKQRVVVEFKDLLYWAMSDPTVHSMELPIPIGINHRGEKAALDLTQMPHILMAGSTGSGKSIFESAIICNLAYLKTPSQLHLYLVDTKKVDLPLFRGLPHVHAVADTLDTFNSMMSNIMLETRRRLNVFQGASCRNIQAYHKMGYQLPYIVIMLDEFGDLMEIDNATRKAEMGEKPEDRKYKDIPTVRSWLKQIIQIGRAPGIHVIGATQRTDVKTVDGTIKANFPCRISLRLPTGVDSRTILGVNGAENLLGKGDMLIQRPESDVLERFHGPFVSMKDVMELTTNYDQIAASLRR